MMQRDAVIEPAVVQIHRNANVVGAKAPRRCDDSPVVHLSANALPKCQRERVGQVVTNTRVCGDAAVDLGQRPQQDLDTPSRVRGVGGPAHLFTLRLRERVDRPVR